MSIPYQLKYPHVSYNLELVTKALERALELHKNQKRKFSGLPYIVHPIRVAIRFSFTDRAKMMNRAAHCIIMAACFLHDVLEDCDITHEELVKEFGVVADIVDELTNQFTKELHPRKNRRERKKLEHERLGKVSVHAKTIKALDRLDNLSDMIGTDDKKWIKQYCKESRHLVEQLYTGSDEDCENLPEELYEMLLSKIKEVEETT